MKKTAQVALLFAFVLVTPKAFSSVRVNTCRTCYIDYENGNDSWSGTAQTFQGGAVGPWKHAPGMQGLTPSGSTTNDGCSGNCASQVPIAGDKYILKGGVIWPYTAAPWWWPWSGTTSTQKYGCAGPGCIYVGNAVGAGLPAWNKGIVNSIVLTRDLGGWNPASPPTISCSGGGGSGAAATPLVMPSAQGDPLIAGFIYHVTLTAQGSGYTSAPICTIAGGGGGAVLAADIDRAVVDLGAAQSSPPDWPVGEYLSYPNTFSPSPGISSYDIFSGVEVRNILQQQRNPGNSGGNEQTAMVAEGAHSTISNLYVHGRFVDCVSAGSCSTTMEVADWAISPGNAYAEVANSIIENGDAFFLGTSTSQANGICWSNTACTFAAMGIATGTQLMHGPVSVHGNKIYSDSWQIRLAGNDASGSDPFLVYGNEVWLTLYNVNASAHINRRYSQLQSPTTLISYNNIDHNHVEGSGNQQQCGAGVTFYFFNEVIWGTGTSTPPYGMTPESGGCTAYFYNDTLYNPTAPYDCLNSGNATVATKVVMQNIHCISGPTVADPFAGSASDVIFENQAGSSNPSAVQAASTVQSVSTANAQGYTSSNLYGPTSASNGTVTFAKGTGSVNLSSLCSGTLAALCSDINGNPRPPFGAAGWQAGAYVYGSGGSSPVAAPTGLTAVVE